MQTQIIIFGTHAQEAKEVFDALEQFQDWEVAAVSNVEHALEKMHRQAVNMIVFTQGVSIVDENKLRKVGAILNEEIVFLHHNGQILFKQQIVSALNRQRLARDARYMILDNGLKHVSISLN